MWKKSIRYREIDPIREYLSKTHMKNIGYILTHMLQYLQWDSFQVNLQFVPWYSFIEISLKKPISSLNLTYLDSMIFSAIIL